jgi:hypothetical protein
MQQQHEKLRAWSGAPAAWLALALIAGPAQAGDSSSSGGTDPVFGNRTENRDGSVAMTVGRNLATEWDSKIGTDVKLSSPGGTSASENFLRGTPADRTSGAVWGSITMPGLTPYAWDKIALEARLDAADDQRKLGATLSRSVPVTQGLSVTIKNSYSVTQPLAANGMPLVGAPPVAAPDAPSWGTDQSLRLNLDTSGTALQAGGGTSSTNDQWHNKLSVEQTLFGPLKVTTAVEDAGKAASKKSVTAGFKRTW